MDEADLPAAELTALVTRGLVRSLRQARQVALLCAVAHRPELHFGRVRDALRATREPGGRRGPGKLPPAGRDGERTAI